MEKPDAQACYPATNTTCHTHTGLDVACFLSIDYAQESQPLDWIRVEGNQFVNESGETIVFRGVNIKDPHRLAQQDRWRRSHFEEARKWGANVIRLPVHPDSWRERGEAEYVKLLDLGVQWARELGLYLILDWHSIGNLHEEKFQNRSYITTVEETHDFWRAMSQHYANEPVVAMYELYNEPTVSGQQFGKCSWPVWKQMNEQMIQLIRKHHPRAVILVAGFDWAYDLTPIRDNPIDATGIAYVSHPYPEKRKMPWEPQWERDWGYVAKKYPVVLSEIGFALPSEKGAHMPVRNDERYGKALLAFAAERGVSWVVWCFDPDWAPFMFSDWNYTPTRQGVFFKKALQAANK